MLPKTANSNAMQLLRLSEEQKVTEWTKFAEIFERIGLTGFYDMSELEKTVPQSPCAINEDSGTAYKGALLTHINMSAAIAQRLLKIVSGTLKISEFSLLRVCYIMHLSKRFIFTDNDNEWEMRNLGKMFKFADNIEGVLYSGERSALEALNNGVILSPVEFEAIKIMDRSDDEKRLRQSPLSMIVRQANEMAYMVEKERFRILKEEKNGDKSSK